MRFIVDEVPKSTLECDLIDFMTMHCPLTKTDCDIWLRGECRQLVSYPDYIRERETQCSGQMEGHAHDT